MEPLYWLDRIQPSHASFVGEKALALSQLGLPDAIVPGLVISTARLQAFLEQVGRDEPLFADLADSGLHIDVDDPRALQAIARQVREGLLKTPLPPAWLAEVVEAVRGWQASSLIVRPSLVLPPEEPQQFAGLLRSRVCRCEAGAIEAALKWVWAERFRAASLYCFASAFASAKAVDLALLIQPLREARASGTVEINGSEAVVCSVWGLGHSLSRGEVRPDCDIASLLPDAYSSRGQPAGKIPTPKKEASSRALLRRLGQKNLLYRLGQALESPSQATEASVALAENLQVTLSSQAQQEAHCLSELDLEALLALTRQAIARNPQIAYLEWTQIDPPSGPSPAAESAASFFIVQCSPRARTHAVGQQKSHYGPTENELESATLRGLPASPGRTCAQAESIADLMPAAPLPPGRILVAKEIAPEWLPLIEGVAGIVTERGGVTSHAAIIARELGIPAIVGVRDATTEIQSGETLSMDGGNGNIYRQEMRSLSVSAEPPAPALPPFPIATQLYLNLSQLQGLEQIARLPVDGVGLLRSELTIVSLLDRKPLSWWLHVSQKEQFVKRLAEQIARFAGGFAPRPVFYRSTDWRSRELFPDSGEAKSGRNPILGRRGTLTYILDPTLFEAELAALARVQALGYNNVSLILPFVRDVEEFVFCRDRVRQIGLMQDSNFQLWIMAEVPSVYYLLSDYVKAGVRGISIGTNDLTQLLLGVDREQPELGRLFDERHPAVLGAVRQFIESARSLNIPCSICGQAPVLYPESIDLFVQWGISAISVEAGAVEQTYWAIARAEQRLLLEAVRRKL